MGRKIASTTLLVSFIALASSGLMMMFIGSFEFNLRMHPVHKIFGLVMVVSGIFHVIYNFKSIKKYLTSQRLLIFVLVMMVIMGLLYVAGFKRTIDPAMIEQVEEAISSVQGDL